MSDQTIIDIINQIKTTPRLQELVKKVEKKLILEKRERETLCQELYQQH